MSIGHMGWIDSHHDPTALRDLEKGLYDEFGTQYFGTMANSLYGTGKGKLSLPFLSLMKSDDGAFTERQTTGDCTSHGTRNAFDISRAVEIWVKGDAESFLARGATEPIYGYRGFGGQGMSPARASNWCRDYGIIPRRVVAGVDFTRYDSRIGTAWGRSGVPEEVAAAAREHPCRHIARVRNVEEARDALANGYGLHVGSQAGFSDTRDNRGIARRSGSWNHDMCWGGCDDTGVEMIFYLFNSWGKWNGGGHPGDFELPDGAFGIRQSDAEYMIRTGEAWAIGDVHGFAPRDLPDYGTGEFL